MLLGDAVFGNARESGNVKTKRVIKRHGAFGFGIDVMVYRSFSSPLHVESC